MFKLDRIDIQRIVVAGAGALVLSLTFVGAAVAPAAVAELPPAVASHA